MATFRIDKRFKGVGRIAIFSGTNDKNVFNGILTMLSDLQERGRLDDLKAIQSRHVHPLTAYNTWKQGRLIGVASVAHITPLKETLEDWLKTYKIAETTRVGYRTCINQLTKLAKKNSTVADLPSVLVTYKRFCVKNGITKSFNQTRAVLMAYTRDMFSKNSELYREIQAVDVIPHVKVRMNNPLSPDEVRELVKDMKPEVAAMIWTMVLTGAGPKEYLKDGLIDVDHGIQIQGQKNVNRNRLVPRVQAPAKPVLQYKRLSMLVKAVREDVTCYDFRRTFAVWCEDAGILDSHVQSYMGHGGNMTRLYQKQNMIKFLAEDAEKLREYIKPKKAKTPAKQVPKVNPNASKFFDID